MSSAKVAFDAFLPHRSCRLVNPGTTHKSGRDCPGAAVIGATDVFVSYKAEDRARLRPLIAALEEEGFTVWWDTHIGGGAHWREDIQEHLDAARCVIVVWSKRSVGPEGDFVRDEASRARKRGAYLPVSLDAVEPPLGFGEVQSIFLKGWRGDRSDPRFQAVAEAVRRRIAGEDIAHVKIGHDKQGVSRRTVIAGSAAVVALAAAGGAWVLLKPERADIRRIAVLPFDNLSADPGQAYFADGIAEELRSALARIGLQVIGRASSDAVKNLDTKVAAERLGVANILTGSVRRSPQMVRISAQLISGKDGVERWEQSYDRAAGDEIKIQTDIATSVAQSLSIALGQAGKAALNLGGTRDAAAQDLFLRAAGLNANDASENALREAVELLDAALARDPQYANAYRTKSSMLELIATSYTKGAAQMAKVLDDAETAAKRAIALAPTLGSGYAQMALIEEDRFNFPSAFRYVRQALALSPADPLVLPSAMYITWYLGGDPRKALSLANRVIQLDPLAASNYTRRASVLIDLRQYAEAIRSARKSLQLAPGREWPHQLIGDSLLLMNRPAEASAEYANVAPGDVYRLRGEAVISARAGDREALERIVSQIRVAFADAATFQFAEIYAQARDNDRAFEALDKGLKVKDPGITGVRTDPFLDPIRDDPRYPAFVKKLNFPTPS
jgi:serine/threonine-protein kinase